VSSAEKRNLRYFLFGIEVTSIVSPEDPSVVLAISSHQMPPVSPPPVAAQSILADVTALSAIFPVVTLSSAILAVVTALLARLAAAIAPLNSL